VPVLNGTGGSIDSVSSPQFSPSVISRRDF
jgi:hypothetical protein